MAPEHEDFAHDVEDELKADIAFERAELDASIKHDYSTAETGIVPLEHRRPVWHFMGLWTTFVAGFSYMALGIEIYSGGHTLAKTVLITVVGYGLYIAYAMFGAYLGSRTGQTHALLTRSIFGTGGSWLVSAFVLVAPLGWVGFQAGLLAQIWDGFYSWGHLELFSILLAGIMIFNNLFGFSGISVFARYLVTPILIVWAVYMVAKGFIDDGGHLSGAPAGGGFPAWVAVTGVIGFAMWGNEPDVWRYGKPKFVWPLSTYLFAGLWFLLFTMAGWMMAKLAASGDQATVFRFTVHYSLFGIFWLALIIATISQFAINDGNYYESVNAGQNLLGSWKPWRRIYTCVIVAAGGAWAGYLVNFKFVDGWFKVAAFLAVTVPCATVIMAVDHFLLPRWFKISRPLTAVPTFTEAGPVNIPAVLALLGAVFFGVTGTAGWPNGWLEAAEPNSWGPVPLEAWLLAGVLYIALVALVRVAVPNVKSALAFSKQALAANVPDDAIVDIASQS